MGWTGITSDQTTLFNLFVGLTVVIECITIVPLIVARFGICWGHTFTQSTRFLAFFSNSTFPATGFCKCSTVGVFVQTWFLGCWRLFCGSTSSCADGGRNMSANTAHICTTFQLDVSLFTPPVSPAVLDEPVVYTILSAIANHYNGMVYFGIRCTSSKNSTLIWTKCSFWLKKNIYYFYFVKLNLNHIEIKNTYEHSSDE